MPPCLLQGGLRAEPPSPSGAYMNLFFLLTLLLMSAAIPTLHEPGDGDYWLIFAGLFKNQFCLNESIMASII